MHLKVGLLGAGPAADYHLAAFVENDYVGDVILAEPAEELRQQAVDKWGIIKAAHPDFQMVIGDSSVDLVDICAPYPQHRQLALAALEAGKDVIIAPPLADSMEACDEIIASAQRTSRCLFCCLDALFAPHHIEAQKLLEAGQIGRPLTAAVQIAGPPQPGGFVMTLGYEAIYTLEHLLGPVIAVSCRIRREDDGKAEEAAVLALEMSGGGLAGIIGEAHPDVRRYENRLTGTDGFLLLRDDPEDEVALIIGHGEMVSAGHATCPLDFKAWSVARALDHLVQCVVEDKRPQATTEQARSALCVAQAAAESAASGRTILIQGD